MKRAPRSKPSLLFVVRMSWFAVFVSIAGIAAYLYVSQFHILHQATLARDQALPEILDSQRTALNIERFLRFGEAIRSARLSEARRDALNLAQALAMGMAFEKDPEVGRAVWASIASLQAMARLLEERDALGLKARDLGARLAAAEEALQRRLIRAGGVGAGQGAEAALSSLVHILRLPEKIKAVEDLPTLHAEGEKLEQVATDPSLAAFWTSLGAEAADLKDLAAILSTARKYLGLRREIARKAQEVHALWEEVSGATGTATSGLTRNEARRAAEAFTIIADKSVQGMLVGTCWLLGMAVAAPLFGLFARRVLIRPVVQAARGLREVEATGKEVRLPEARIREYDALSRGVERLGAVLDQIGQRGRELEREIAERVAVEDRLRTSEEKYREMFNNALVGFFRTRLDNGMILEANPRALEIVGFASREEVVNRVSVADLYLRREDRVRMIGILQRQGSIQNFETELRRPDGQVVAILIAGSIDRVRGIFDGVFTDITQRKKAEEELALLNRRLEDLVALRTRDLEAKASELEDANMSLRKLDELKSTFLSLVSHELRTPLTSIFGFVKLVARDFRRHFEPLVAGKGALEAKARRIGGNLDIVLKEGERLTRLVNDVLDLSRLESGRMQWRDREILLWECVEAAAAKTATHFLPHTHTRLTARDPGPLPPLYADPDRIAQVFLNLLHNAAKFAPRGHVTVTAKALAPDRVRVTIQDNGQGIAAKDIEAIFDRFHQAGGEDKLLVDKPHGSGLGLAICKEIVEHYGGVIWAESDLGRGSAFHVDLPACEPRDERREEALRRA